MTSWLRSNSTTIWSWVGLVAASAIIFAITYPTPYRQFGIGLLLSSVSLLVTIGIFEALWHFAAKWLPLADEEKTSKDAPKSGPGSGRNRR